VFPIRKELKSQPAWSQTPAVVPAPEQLVVVQANLCQPRAVLELEEVMQ